MLNELHELIFKGHILKLIEEPTTPWRTLEVLYEEPRVERVWLPLDTQKGTRRLYIHRIHPCVRGNALFHPHPWPSAVVVLSIKGSYLMNVGYGPPNRKAPEVAMTLNIRAQSGYQMLNPFTWHDVTPIGGPSLSIMLTGQPWAEIPELTSAQRALNKPLTEAAKQSVLNEALGFLLPDF